MGDKMNGQQDINVNVVKSQKHSSVLTFLDIMVSKHFQQFFLIDALHYKDENHENII